MARNLAVVFYLGESVPDAERRPVEEAIRRSPLVRSAPVVEPDEALGPLPPGFPRARGHHPQPGPNPFPASVEVASQGPGDPDGDVLAFIEGISGIAAVADVQFNRDWADKMRFARAAWPRPSGSSSAASSSWPRSSSSRTSSSSTSWPAAPRSRSSASSARPTPSSACPSSSKGVLGDRPGRLLSIGLVFLLVRLFPTALGQLARRPPGAHRFPLPDRSSRSLALVGGGGLVGFLGSLSSIARFLRT